MQHAAPGHRDEDHRRRQEGDRRPTRRRCTTLGSATHVLDAKTRATTVGMVDWKTIAPVMLPIASVSLPWRTQITELNFSGSSVAIGAMTSASSSAVDAELRRRGARRRRRRRSRRATMRPSATRTWTLTIRSRGTRRLARGARRGRAGGSAAARGPPASTSASACEVALDVPGVDPDAARRPRSTSARPARAAGTPRRWRARRRSRSSACRGRGRRVSTCIVVARRPPAGRPQDRDRRSRTWPASRA